MAEAQLMASGGKACPSWAGLQEKGYGGKVPFIKKSDPMYLTCTSVCNATAPFRACSNAAGGWLLGDDGRLSTLSACWKCSEVLSTLQDQTSVRRDACQLCASVPRTSLRLLLHHRRLESLSTWSSADSLQILNSCQFYSSRAT